MTKRTEIGFTALSRLCGSLEHSWAMVRLGTFTRLQPTIVACMPGIEQSAAFFKHANHAASSVNVPALKSLQVHMVPVEVRKSASGLQPCSGGAHHSAGIGQRIEGKEGHVTAA